ncbi:hypothetical protein V8G54_009463 [Vigna mungo]|uniref:Uncharacterized protein n=1 Tax=Vigna mungo TaxID=3915 RepID=A0AAQ3NU13_VIGMU
MQLNDVDDVKSIVWLLDEFVCWWRQAAARLMQQRMVDNSMVEIGRQCCWRDNDLAGARVKMYGIALGGGARTKVESQWLAISMVVMEVQQKGEAALVVARDALERTVAGKDCGDDAGWCDD